MARSAPNRIAAQNSATGPSVYSVAITMWYPSPGVAPAAADAPAARKGSSGGYASGNGMPPYHKGNHVRCGK